MSAPTPPANDVREAAAAAMTALGCEQTEDQGDGPCCDASIVRCSHPPFLYCDIHDAESEVGEPCPVAVRVATAVLEAAREARL